MRTSIFSFFLGALFAIGLAIAGMTQPSKVINFLDIFGNWDPSLAFVMLGAIAVYLPVFQKINKRVEPLFATKFFVPTRTDIDKKLLFGAGLFGLGWGLSGFCPGPAFASLGSAHSSVLIFVSSMIGGFLIKRIVDLFTQTKEKAFSDSAYSRE